MRYTYTDDLAHVWCQWAEMELKHKQFKRVVELLKDAVTPPPGAKRRLTPEQMRVRPFL